MNEIQKEIHEVRNLYSELFLIFLTHFNILYIINDVFIRYE